LLVVVEVEVETQVVAEVQVDIVHQAMGQVHFKRLH
tara:strand:+ start:89 stop:196 length:108 start_codon:yes stop_codon:yes gene_type:complete